VIQAVQLADAPVGIFDSGVGGLSILRHVREQLPHEHLLYFADNLYSPYGEKSEEWLAERALTITQFLLGRGAKALVVACNTATIAAIRLMRSHYPNLPIVGVEPGLKPAAVLSKSGKVGVLATDATLAGEKFLLLRDQVSQASEAEFLLQACTGLADQIEAGALDSEETLAMLSKYIAPLLDQGADTLVLGCTHYPFVRTAIETLLAGRAVTLVDTGDAVARQLGRLLESGGIARAAGASTLQGFTSGSMDGLKWGFENLLKVDAPVIQVDLP
jgi:glutamate racemase